MTERGYFEQFFADLDYVEMVSRKFVKIRIPYRNRWVTIEQRWDGNEWSVSIINYPITAYDEFLDIAIMSALESLDDYWKGQQS